MTTLTTEQVKVSKWVKVDKNQHKVSFTPRQGHREVIISFRNPKLFDPPCSVLHITRPETVTMEAIDGESLYDVFEPDSIRRHVTVAPGTGPGNAKSYVPETSNPSGPIIVP